MKTTTATSMGSAMQLAYAYGGRAPVVLSEADMREAEQVGRGLRLPAYATCLVVVDEHACHLRPIVAGRIGEPSMRIEFVGDALSVS